MEREELATDLRNQRDTYLQTVAQIDTITTPSSNTKESNIAEMKEDSKRVHRGLRGGARGFLLAMPLLTLGLIPGTKAQAQRVGDEISLDELQRLSAQRRQQGSTISYNDARQYAQTSASGYGHTQSPLGMAQSTIINRDLIIDAKLTEGLNREIYAYACFNGSNRDNICLVRRDGKVENKSRGRCFSDQTGVCNAYCGEQRHISLEEATQLASAGFAIENHTDITRQVYRSVMVEGAIMDGEVPTPMEEVVAWNARGYYLDNELSAGINPESGVYTVLTNRTNGQSVVISRNAHYDEQTGQVTCAKLERTAKLRSDKAGNVSPYNGRNGNDQLKDILPARGQPLRMGRVLQQGGPSKAEKRVNTFQGNRQINGRGGRSW